MELARHHLKDLCLQSLLDGSPCLLGDTVIAAVLGKDGDKQWPAVGKVGCCQAGTTHAPVEAPMQPVLRSKDCRVDGIIHL